MVVIMGQLMKLHIWTEEYQEKIYIDQVEMFNTIPNLSGICPWLTISHREECILFIKRATTEKDCCPKKEIKRKRGTS